MFYSQNPEVFGPARYEISEDQFDEWAYATPMVSRVGTDFRRQITFCPVGGPPEGGREFHGPYATLVQFITQMNKDRKFSEESPWFQLIKYSPALKGGNFLPPIKTYYLMTSLLLLSAKEEYNRDTRNRSEIQETFIGPNGLGKGLEPGGKLAVMMVTTQVWNDLTRAMNLRGRDGNFVYQNPCDPAQMAVFYAWNHRKAKCPVPGVTSTTDIDGMSGTVAGQLFAPNGQVLAPGVGVPQSWVTPQGGPSDEYFTKVPLHVAEVINYMDDFTMIKELAAAFCDAKVIFELAYKGTDYEQYLDEPDVKSLFGGTAQKFVYDSSIFEGAPVSRQAPQMPAQQVQMPQMPPSPYQQGQAPTQYAPRPAGPQGISPRPPAQVHHQYVPPNPPQHLVHPTVPIPQAPYQMPAINTPGTGISPPYNPQTDAFPRGVNEPALDEQAPWELPSMNEIYMGDNGIAVDVNGQPYLDENGNPWDCHEFATYVAQQYEAASYQ